MADLTTSADVDAFLAAANNAAARAALGAAAPGLPIWTYTAGAMASGKLKSDDSSMALTTLIKVSLTPKNGGGGAEALEYIAASGMGAQLVFTDAAGTGFNFHVNSVAVGGSSIDFTVDGTPIGTWSGEYQVYAVARVGDVTLTNVLTSSNITPVADATYLGSFTTSKGVITVADSITPAADNTYVLPSSITIVKGIITAIS